MLFPLYFLCHATTLCAQRLFYPARAINLSSANYSRSVSDPLTAANNPALLPQMRGLATGVYCENRYVKELSLVQLSATYSFDGNGASLSYQRFGNSEFAESKLTASYGKNFGRIKAGIQFDYILVTTRGYATLKMVQPSASGIFPISDDTYINVRLSNPSIMKSKNSSIIPASCYKMGIGWSPSEFIYTAIELDKLQERPVAVIGCITYQFKNNLSAKLFWNTLINQPVIVVSWRIRSFSFQIGAGFNMPLGYCPSSGIVFQPETQKLSSN